MINFTALFFYKIVPRQNIKEKLLIKFIDKKLIEILQFTKVIKPVGDQIYQQSRKRIKNK